MSAIGACVIGIIAAALWRFARTGIRDAFTAVIACAAALIVFVPTRFAVYQPELIALAVAAVLGAVWYARPRPSIGTLAIAPLPWWDADLARLALFFLKVGATLFGSGYVLVSYLKAGLVDQYGWLTEPQLLDAIAIGQITPGPLLTTATFAGYVIAHTTFEGGVTGGIFGAIVATIAIFLPSFLFILVLGPVLQRLRTNRYARGALDGMNAAVVALIFVVLLRLADASFLPRGQLHAGNVIVAVATLAALLAWNVNTTWLILAAAVAGWAMS